MFGGILEISMHLNGIFCVPIVARFVWFTTGPKPGCCCFFLICMCNILSDVLSFLSLSDLSWVILFFIITVVTKLNAVILYQRCLTLQFGILTPRNMGLVPEPVGCAGTHMAWLGNMVLIVVDSAFVLIPRTLDLSSIGKRWSLGERAAESRSFQNSVMER